MVTEVRRLWRLRSVLPLLAIVSVAKTCAIKLLVERDSYQVKVPLPPTGNELGFSIPPLQTEAALGHFDAVLHVGDMAYDMAQDNAR